MNKRSSFQHVSEANVKKVVKKLSLDKAFTTEIPIKILTQSKFCFSELINCVNEFLRDNKIKDISKLYGITPVFEKLDPSDKANYIDR